ncbi:radical SAM protein [Pedobacter sp. R20-19]|uniref:radical SAM protein n=1 Tax=Pedobacter sp. R20-19 TaxID=1270196 RepID=UPI0009E96209|nr:radical SAM protein [Pedobacter sp. R20-19]
MEEAAKLKCNFVVLKIASRCNLNCSYCIMYNVGDDTYKKQPKVMSDKTVDALLNRIKKHCLKHDIKIFDFSFHGGEPLLAGPEFFIKFIQKVKEILPPHIQISYTLQTNGILISDEWCDLFAKLNIFIAVSLDGTPAANDKFRVDHAGRGSYKAIVSGLKIAQRSKALNYSPNILSVINVESDPTEVYNHFKSLGVQSVDFILPHQIHEEKPLSIYEGDINFEATPYGDWLVKIFDQWFYEKKPRPEIRFFDVIIACILGMDVPFEYLGGQKNEILVIETNGGIEAVDSLKACGNGFTKNGVNVATHDIDEALENELAQVYSMSHQLLCKQCSCCPIKNVCGGGFLPDRYSKQNGFNNPSVYCKDLTRIITHIQNAIIDCLDPVDTAVLEIKKLTYLDVRKSIIKKMNVTAEPTYLALLEKFKQADQIYEKNIA